MSSRSEIRVIDLSFAAGLLVGAAIGTVLGLIYAPKAGTETREDIRRKSRELREGTADAVSKLREAGGRVIRRGRETADDPDNSGMES
jgi:gas vesicle protein